MRKGVVVEIHPEDNSVDLVMVDDGARLVGVQCMVSSASSRSGTIDLPDIIPRANKWDITQRTVQDIEACVDYIGRQPVVVGFLFPQINQVLWKDKKRRIFRHQSDVSSFIDGDGNYQMDWPNGLGVRVGVGEFEETEGKNFDENSKVDRNTTKAYGIKIKLPIGEIIDISPDGVITITATALNLLTASGLVSGNMTAAGELTLAPKLFNLIVDTTATMKATAWIFEGNAHFKDQIDSDVNVIAGPIGSKVGLVTHLHPLPVGTSSAPTPNT